MCLRVYVCVCVSVVSEAFRGNYGLQVSLPTSTSGNTMHLKVGFKNTVCLNTSQVFLS